MAKACGDGDIRPCMICSSSAERERRVLNAIVFALAVFAQLLLPALWLRAEAAADTLCVTRSDDNGGDKSTSHAHDQTCGHCRLQACGGLAPPSVRAVAMWPTKAAREALPLILRPASSAPLAQQPPRGPPLS